MSSTQHTDTLNQLWFNREHLTETEWTELYQLVFSILKNYRLPIINSLEFDHEDYIQQCFIEKVFTKTSKKTDKKIHAGYIKTIYKCFLSDQLKSRNEKNRQKNSSTEKDDYAEKTNEEASTLDETELLDEYGMTLEHLSQSAKIFYSGLEQWAQQYLSLHFCPDSQEALALNALAKRYQISSYHYKAGLLGITRKKSDSYQDYDKTLLGDWLINTLKIDWSRENEKFMTLILKILCVTALNNEETK